MRALWALHVTKGLNEAELLAQLKNPSEHVRAWAIQLLCEEQAPSVAALAIFEQLAKDEPSAKVRLNLASALQRMPLAARWPIVTHLAAREEDNPDHNIPLMVWYGIEPAIAADRKAALTLMRNSMLKTLREFIPRRLGGGDE